MNGFLVGKVSRGSRVKTPGERIWGKGLHEEVKVLLETLSKR